MVFFLVNLCERTVGKKIAERFFKIGRSGVEDSDQEHERIPETLPKVKTALVPEQDIGAKVIFFQIFHKHQRSYKCRPESMYNLPFISAVMANDR